MTDSLVILERRTDNVAIITLNNPKVNALSVALLNELKTVALELTANPVGCVVVTGGDRIFAAGANIDEFSGPSEAKVIGGAFHGALNAVAAIPSFVIAAVNGFALGGGCEFALACDYRIASTKAVFGQPEILLGIIPGGGGTQRLPRLIGASRAKELMITGRQVRAEEALAIGLANEVVEPDSVLARAIELANSIAGGALVAQRMIKRAVDDGLEMPLVDALALEVDLFEHVFTTADSQIGIASFREHGPGKASFTGE